MTKALIKLGIAWLIVMAAATLFLISCLVYSEVRGAVTNIQDCGDPLGCPLDY